MSFDTACFSMYSDISKRMRWRCDPKRNSARRRATSVLPTPDEPRKMNDPIGGLGVATSRRERRIAREVARIALSLATTLGIRAPAMLTSFPVSEVAVGFTGLVL